MRLDLRLLIVILNAIPLGSVADWLYPILLSVQSEQVESRRAALLFWDQHRWDRRVQKEWSVRYLRQDFLLVW